MVKTFVIDTNVVLFDPEAIFKFEEHNIIIPNVVLEEVDHFKSEQSERGVNSRKFSRYMDTLCQKGNLKEGVSLGKKKGIIKILFTPAFEKLNLFPFEEKTADNKILSLCLQTSTILVTKDINLRVKANSIGVIAEDYKNEKVIGTKETVYNGRTKALVLSKNIASFKEKGFLKENALLGEDGNPFTDKLITNEFIEMYSADTNSNSAILGRFDGQKIVPLQYMHERPYGVIPKNIGQIFMMEALMQPANVAPLVIIKGIAGTAKTFFSVAAGLEKYKSNEENYDRILICRPSVTMDEDIGFLPGSEKSKIEPFMRAIKDNLFNLKKGENKLSIRDIEMLDKEIDEMFESNFIKSEALAFQRGRSLNNHWFILDEMQNATIKQVKSIITRGGLNTKIILLGDPEQIDSPYMDAYNNGLSYASEKMKGSPLCWQVTMKESECVRSPLAKEAATKL